MHRGRGRGLRKQPVWKVVVEGATRRAGMTRDRARILAMELRQCGQSAQVFAAPPPFIRVDEHQLQEQLSVFLGR